MLQVSEYDQITSWWLYTFGKKPIYVYHGPYDSDISKKHVIKCKIIDALLLHKKNTAKTTVFTKSELATASIKKRNFGKVITVGVGLDTERFSEINESASDFYSQLKNLKEDQSLNYLLYIGVLEERRNIIATTVWAIVGTVILYFSGKVLAYFRLYNRYMKKIKEDPENKEIKKPKIEIKLKYIFILFVVIDVLLWTIIIFR